MAEAVQQHLHDDSNDIEDIRLTPEQIDIVRRGQAEMREGKGATIDQARAELAEHRAAWQQANPS